MRRSLQSVPHAGAHKGLVVAFLICALAVAAVFGCQHAAVGWPSNVVAVSSPSY